MSKMDILNTAEEVAAFTGGKVAVSTVRYWGWKGALASVKRGRRRLYRRADIVKFFGLTDADFAEANPAPTPPVTGAAHVLACPFCRRVMTVAVVASP